MIFAAVEWQGLAALGAVLVSAAGTVLAFRRGSRGDEALALSQAADRRSKETETVLTTQGSIIDQLQEEITRYRTELQDKQDQLEQRHAALEECRKELREARHEFAAARASVKAAETVIAALDTEISSLRRLVNDHEHTIAMHEQTISEMRLQLEKQ